MNVPWPMMIYRSTWITNVIVVRHYTPFRMKKSLKIPKGVIRIRKSKVRQHNGQNEKDKRTKNDLQNIAHKIKDRVTRTPTKTRDELRWSWRVSSSCSTSGTRRVNLLTNPMINSKLLFCIQNPTSGLFMRSATLSIFHISLPIS